MPLRHGGRTGAYMRAGSTLPERLSGAHFRPLLDRIDLRVDMPAVSALDLIAPGQSEKSETVARRVARARAVQAARYERAPVSIHQ